MKKTLCLLAVLTTILLSTLPFTAQAQQKRLSPHETISTVINGNRVTLVYGRPYTTKPGTDVARKIWGGLIPYDKVWRMGADEATLFITQKPIIVGGATVPAGAYTLFLLPSADGAAKLIISKQIGQWGEEYDAASDLARVDLTKTTLDQPVTQFTLAITKNSSGGQLQISWETTAYSLPFTPAP
jgi:hypothetical protein